MADAVFKTVFAGPHASIQDGGRRGLMRFGVPASGPMDRKSFALANLALGKDADAAGIEISMGGLVLDCVSGATTLAIAGGGFIVERDGARLGSWSTLPIRAGQKLTIRPGPWGSWTYLAFAGKLTATQWLGSAATHALSGFGGGKLTTGQEITITDAIQHSDAITAIACPIWARPRQHLHVVLGPQDRYFSAAALQALLTEPFYLTSAYDRMGLRLRGPSLAPDAALSIPSEAILRGSVQVSGDGVPTVLLSDHQTTGGYPKIATVLADDLDGFVQLRTNDAVAFKAITAPQAVQLARTRAAAIATVYAKVRDLAGR
ncbi:MAG: allophanate hydrolase [Rhodobacterales bacterium RIFCSPHIGHO2_02_FULL_62_130]|nr:MAG: allophanate hydrolase [Rhodobacterales bacterium RIFCSPHIGHO2_02_FULL_62_130]OHC54177.1 MAG: allophanate hydrolase [Rhodobacterales bacterium RIFCSPHIGHO2_12_FULL_62_75]HCY99712.1 allophanate hydrolase [Rhodobacter sp.]